MHWRWHVLAVLSDSDPTVFRCKHFPRNCVVAEELDSYSLRVFRPVVGVSELPQDYCAEAMVTLSLVNVSHFLTNVCGPLPLQTIRNIGSICLGTKLSLPILHVRPLLLDAKVNNRIPFQKNNELISPSQNHFPMTLKSPEVTQCYVVQVVIVT